MRIGIPSVDEIIGGISQTAHVIIAGETSRGKSVLLAQIAMHLARQDSRSVVFFGLEMDEKELMTRWAAQLAGVPVGDDHRRKLLDGFAQVDTLINREQRIHLICGSQDIGPIEQQSEAIVATMLTAGVFVDYLQLVAGDRRARTREEEVGGVSRRLKQLVARLRVPVFVACQFNRSGVDRPGLKQLRESGAIEQNANCVMAIYPTQKPTKVSPTVDAEIAVLKNRNHSMGIARKLKWGGHLYRFRDTDVYDMPHYDPNLIIPD
jgi:replicative DNA helicase